MCSCFKDTQGIITILSPALDQAWRFTLELICQANIKEGGGELPGVTDSESVMLGSVPNGGKRS